MAKVELRRRRAHERSLESSLGLTEEQRATVERPAASKTLISGAAGTGKTEALIARALHLLKNGVAPDRLLIVTFSRDHADYLRDEIALRAGTITYEPLARSFSSIAFSIVRMSLEEDLREPILLSGADQDQLIRELLESDSEINKSGWPDLYQQALETRGFAKELRDLISRAKEWGLFPEDLKKLGESYGEDLWIAASRFWERYEKVSVMRESGVGDPKERIDPSELINRASRILENSSDLRRKLSSAFDHILIDECEESDPSHRRLLSAMAPEGFSIYYDVKSSASRFRGADPEGLESYLETLKAESFTLSKIFRQPATILLSEHSSIAEQARYIATEFRKLHMRSEIPWSEMAVIVRSPGEHLSALRRELTLSSVPVVQEAGTASLAESSAIKPILTIAEIAIKSSRRSELQISYQAIEELLLSEFGGLEPLLLKRIRNEINRNREENDLRALDEIIIEAVTTDEALSPLIDIPIAKEIVELNALIKRVRRIALAERVTVTDIFAEIFDSAKFEGQLIKNLWQDRALFSYSVYESAAADRDLDAVIELFEAAKRHVARFPYAAPELFIDEIKDRTILGDVIAATSEVSERVTLTTVHSAKGKEWRVVAIIGVQEGRWPNLKLRGSLLGSERVVDIQRYGALARSELNAMAGSALSLDELRLFELAKSRASERLFITAVSKEDEEPSPYFYRELEIHGGAEPSDEPFTPSALIASLRLRVENVALSDRERSEAASLLKALASAQVPGADPQRWYGYYQQVTDQELIRADEDIFISPSEIERFNECQLRWFLEKNGGVDGDSAAALLGSALHAYADLIGKSEITLEEAVKRLADTWHLIDLNQGWLRESGLAEAMRRLTRFFQWHSSNPRELLATEAEIEIKLGRATIRGSADRIEIDDEKKVFIVDLKTGKSAQTQKSMPDNKQLAAYQLAVVDSGFSDEVMAKLKDTDLGGAELIYPGTDSKSITVRTQDPVEVDLIRDEINKVAEAMQGPTLIAQVNSNCRTCGVALLCPMQSIGRSVVEK